MKLIVGLGNPGRKYTNTKHNIGFMVVEALANQLGLSWKSPLRIPGQIAKSTNFVLLMPTTFMNLSGSAVVKAMKFYKIMPEDVIVVYDDLDLEVGKLRLRYQGGSGGHNGMASIIPHVGQNAKRIRIGVGRHEFKDAKDDVLSPFNPKEEELVKPAIQQAVKALVEFLEDSPFSNIMNKYNGYPSTE